MAGRVLLVDYENVQALEVATVPPDVRVHVVLGAKQEPVVAKLAAKMKPLGDRFTSCRITTLASNAVDFCVAFYLGELVAQTPDAEYIILSKDKKGFDPMVRHLAQERRFRVRRVNTQKEAFAAKAKAALTTSKSETADGAYARLLMLLRQDKARPRKRKGLKGRLKSWFPALTGGARNSLMQRLDNLGHVRDADGLLQYHV